MKKIIQILVGTSFGLVLAFAGASSAFAQTVENECTIINTGPGSVNECEITNEETCEANNGTFVEINNENEQGSGTGNAGSNGNTTGGGATSGDATNTNETEVVIEVENGTCVFSTPVTPEPPVTPPVTPETPAVLSAQTVAPVGSVNAGSNDASVLVLSLSILLVTLGAARLSRLATAKF